MDHVRYLRLTASLKDYFGKMARAEAVAAAVHTPFNLHLHLATSTHFPKVGQAGAAVTAVGKTVLRSDRAALEQPSSGPWCPKRSGTRSSA